MDGHQPRTNLVEIRYLTNPPADNFGSDDITLCRLEPEASCQNSPIFGILDTPFMCPAGQSCVNTHQSPSDGYISFDSVANALLVLFTVTSLENWSGVL